MQSHPSLVCLLTHHASLLCLGQAPPIARQQEQEDARLAADARRQEKKRKRDAASEGEGVSESKDGSESKREGENGSESDDGFGPSSGEEYEPSGSDSDVASEDEDAVRAEVEQVTRQVVASIEDMTKTRSKDLFATVCRLTDLPMTKELKKVVMRVIEETLRQRSLAQTRMQG